MQSNKDITLYTNIAKEPDDVAIPPELEAKMRALANRVVDIILEDRRRQRLNFQVKNNTIVIGHKRYRLKYLE